MVGFRVDSASQIYFGQHKRICGQRSNRFREEMKRFGFDDLGESCGASN